MSDLVPAIGQQRRGSKPPLSFPFGESGGARTVFPHLCEYGLYPPKGQLPVPIDENEAFTATMFLSRFKTTTKHGKLSAWFLAREAGRWGGEIGLCSRVSNGALILAAIRLGLVVDEHQNCLLLFADALIGVGARTLKTLGYK